MRIVINFEKRHFYTVSLLLVLVLGAIAVQGFGSGGPPATVGHDQAELDIDCVTVTGGAGLCDGSDAVNDGDTSSSNEIQDLAEVRTEGGCTNCITGSDVDESSLGTVPTATTANACNGDATCETGNFIDQSGGMGIGAISLGVKTKVHLGLQGTIPGQNCNFKCDVAGDGDGVNSGVCLGQWRTAAAGDPQVGCGFNTLAGESDTCLCASFDFN